MNRFDGKVVIVTGAGSGIGAATARRFLREGAFVALNGRREYKLRETMAGFDFERVLAPWPVRKTVTILPDAAGFPAPFTVPSWFSASMRVALETKISGATVAI